MNELYKGAQLANELIRAVMPAMEQQAERLQGLGAQLQTLNVTQQQLSAGMQKSMGDLEAISTQTHVLETSMHESLQNEVSRADMLAQSR